MINLLSLLPIALIVALILAVLSPLLILIKLVQAIAFAFRRLFGAPVAAPQSTHVTAEDCSSNRPILFTVHGTFARGAQWARDDSALVEALTTASEQRTGLRPLIHRLEWSGANTVAARVQAIHELREKLQQVFSARPDRSVCLIGHSHGGNVAMKVATDFAHHPGLAVVTLATPFLLAQHRPFPIVFALLMRGLAVVGFMVSLIALGLVLHHFGIAASWWLAIGGLLVVGWAVWSLHSDLLRDPVAEALFSSTINAVDCQTLIHKSLIVSRTSDEADGILKLSALLGNWIASRLRNSEFVRQTITALAKLLDAIEISAVDKAKAMDALATGRPLPPLVSLPAGAPAILSVLKRPDVLLALWRVVRAAQQAGYDAIAVLIGLMLLGLVRIALGTGNSVVSTTVLVSSSETPPGMWQHLQTLTSADPQSSLLSHSQIYDDANVQRHVASWWSQRLTR